MDEEEEEGEEELVRASILLGLLVISRIWSKLRSERIW